MLFCDVLTSDHQLVLNRATKAVLKIIFCLARGSIGISMEKIKNYDHEVNKSLPEKRNIHVFNYSYKAKTGIPLDIQFHVDDELFKRGDTYPKHFYFVNVTAKK